MDGFQKEPTHLNASLVDLRINVNTFQEKVVVMDHLSWFLSRNGRLVWSRVGLTVEHLKRAKSSEEDKMRIIEVKDVVEGNG